MTLRFIMSTGIVLSLALSCSENSGPEVSSVGSTEKNAQIVITDTFEVGKGVVVRALALEKSGVVWIGTSVGALQVDGKTGKLVNTYTRENGLANEYIFAAKVGVNGQVWLGTNGGGVSTLQDGKWKTLFPMHGLADYWVYSFGEQASGEMWIGTWAGLTRVEAKNGKLTTFLKELVNEWVYGIDVDSKDQVWIGTEGGVNMFDGERWYVWTHKDGIGAPNTKNLPFSSNTGLGTRSRHDLSVVALGKETYNPNYVFCVEVDQKNRVWVGTWGGGASVYDGTKWTNFVVDDGLVGNIVYSIDEGPDGHLWFGTNRGISRFDGQNWKSLTINDGLLDDHVYAVLAEPSGDVWAGTAHGVVKIRTM
ncbi:MAG: regulator [Gammaproteobacteria bacterium]|nr:regulator [Gammaproteobacteria bacterium]